jgi:hypothetical protein
MGNKPDCTPSQINDQVRLLAVLGRRTMGEHALLEAFRHLYPECPPAVADDALHALEEAGRIERTRDGSLFLSLRHRGPLSSGLHL